MTDIVTELRQHAKDYQSNFGLMLEAADEIEMLNKASDAMRNEVYGLRAEIKWLQAALQEIMKDANDAWVSETVRRALEHKP